MVIKSLKLKNYRNYELLDMTFDSKTNILYGDNAQGKTNILEALYLSGYDKIPQRDKRQRFDTVRQRGITSGDDRREKGDGIPD